MIVYDIVHTLEMYLYFVLAVPLQWNTLYYCSLSMKKTLFFAATPFVPYYHVFVENNSVLCCINI